MHYRTTKMTGQTGMKRLEIESFTEGLQGCWQRHIGWNCSRSHAQRPEKLACVQTVQCSEPRLKKAVSATMQTSTGPRNDFEQPCGIKQPTNMPVALKTPLTSEPTGLMIIVTAYAANKFFFNTTAKDVILCNVFSIYVVVQVLTRTM